MNKYSNIVNIPPILSTLKDYVIVKKAPDFPNYYDFDDIDIFCLRPQQFIENLVANIKCSHKQPYKITMIEKDYNIKLGEKKNFDNYQLAIEAGANILVSGTTIFKSNDGDIKKNINLLKLK